MKININAVLAHCTFSIFDDFYNKHWNWYLFCLLLLVHKKDDARVMLNTRTETTIY